MRLLHKRGGVCTRGGGGGIVAAGGRMGLHMAQRTAAAHPESCVPQHTRHLLLNVLADWICVMCGRSPQSPE